MGTRSLTMVIDQQGEKKVAQYGQWQGQPSGVGNDVLRFLKDKNLFDKFKSNLSKVRFLDEEGVDKDFIESYNNNIPKSGNDLSVHIKVGENDSLDKRTEEQKRWFNTYCTRDLAANVLTNIANSTDDEIILFNKEETATGNGWVEYSYVINLKENTLGIYTHIDKDPMKVYPLDKLPKGMPSFNNKN